MEQRRSDLLKWNRRTLEGAYDQLGNQGPRWDEQAREAMELAAWLFSREPDLTQSFADLNRVAKAAIDAGCDDPLLAYLYYRSSDEPAVAGEQDARRLRASAKALVASRYPPFAARPPSGSPSPIPSRLRSITCTSTT